MSNSFPFKVKVTNENRILTISIQGFIDKNFNNFSVELAKLSPKFDQVVFDLSELTHIDSSGIKEWIRMVEGMKPTPIVYKKCPAFFINQLNMVDGMLLFNTVVESCFVPYYSDELDKEVNLLIPVSKTAAAINAIQAEIERDGVKYKIDVVKENFFKFLRMKN